MPPILDSITSRFGGAASSKRSVFIGAGTLTCALGIGYVMQYGFGLPQAQHVSAAPPEVEITAIEPASSAASVGGFFPAAFLSGASADETATLAAAEDIWPETAPAREDPATGADCAISIRAEVVAGAMVTLDLSAPCNPSERLTLHHMGLMFTEVLDTEGTLRVTVPALAQQALFIVETASGGSASALTEVSSLPFYDRVAVQWKGQSGLQLHAREYAADYFADGHVWADAAGDVVNAALGNGGFLTSLGNADTPDALRAEVYSFPSGTATRQGDVLVSVEAEITDTNCDRAIEAQTLDIREGARLTTRALSLQMPGCDSLGDFLVLKNLIEDLKIAAR